MGTFSQAASSYLVITTSSSCSPLEASLDQQHTWPSLESPAVPGNGNHWRGFLLYRLGLADLDEVAVEGGAVAAVGEGVGGGEVDVPAVGAEAVPPDGGGGDDAGPDRVGDAGAEAARAAVVLDDRPVAVAEAALGGVGAADLERGLF